MKILFVNYILRRVIIEVAWSYRYSLPPCGCVWITELMGGCRDGR